MAPLEDGSSGIEDDNAGARVVNGRLHIIPADPSGNPVDVGYDPTTGRYLLAISGTVALGVTPIPSGATPVSLANDTPLDMSGTNQTTYVITNGKTFYLQQIVAGSQGDPTENGSRVELFFYNGTEHLIARIYLTGFTTFITYPQLNKTRDGVAVTGNGTNYLILRRTRLSGGNQEVDAIIYGYEV